MDEDKRAKLEAELESVQRVLRDTLAWIGDDRHLTQRGIAAREDLYAELDKINQDLEAVRQEHRLD